MKKIGVIVFLCLFSICIVSGKSQDTFIEKIDLKLKEGEIGVVFLPMDKDNYLLIKTKEHTVLLGLDEEEGKIKRLLKKIGQNDIDYNLTEQEIGGTRVSLDTPFLVDNLEIEKIEDNYKIHLQDRILTIYQDGSLEESEYVYFLKPTEIEKGDIKLAFYTDHFDEDFEKELADYWIDSYKIKKNEFTMVKFTQDSYNVIRIPGYYF